MQNLVVDCDDEARRRVLELAEPGQKVCAAHAPLWDPAAWRKVRANQREREKWYATIRWLNRCGLEFTCLPIMNNLVFFFRISTVKTGSPMLKKEEEPRRLVR